MFPDITRDDIFRLETRRLWLRWVRASDAPGIGAIAGLAPVAQMTSAIPHPYPVGEAERFILSARAATASGRALILAVTLKNKARTLIGLASAEANSSREMEVGYFIAPTSAGKGFATEALLALLDTIFSLTEVRTVLAKSRIINPASRRVLEKCGFAFAETAPADMPARGGLHPCDHFKLTRLGWTIRDRNRQMPTMAHQPLRHDEPGRAG